MADPWSREDRPFNFTATGYLGTKREEMLGNHLLEKSRIGVHRKGVQKLSPDTVHGHSFRCQWTAANALNGWSGYLPPIKTGGKRLKKPISDYMHLNRGALTAAVTVSNEIRKFRETKVPIQPLYLESNNKKLERPPRRTFKATDVFGRPIVPTATIEDLITHSYQKEWLKNHKMVELMHKKKIDLKKIRPNRASMLKPQQIPVEVRRLPWRHSMFLEKAQPSISTFRSRKARENALEAQSYEAPGREGMAGQGIPKNTPHEHFLAPLRDPPSCPVSAMRSALQVTSMTDPWARKDNPFNLSATGYLGRKRPDMLSNHLLQRFQLALGRAREPRFELPPNAIYGATFHSPFTVADAMSGWARIPQKEQRVCRPKRVPIDCLSANVAALTRGVKTTEEVSAYRQTRKHIPMNNYDSNNRKPVRPPPVKIEPNVVYGIKSGKDEETMTELIAHVYHKQWYLNSKIDKTIHNKEKANFQKAKSTLTSKLRQINISSRTATSPLARRRLPQSLASIKPHLSTFRSDSARNKAWNAHEQEISEKTCHPICPIDPTESLPYYQRIPPIKHLHLRPPHGPRPSE